MTPFPFIVGCGRSGTTMVRAMLDTHPEMAIPPESYFVVDLAPTAREDGGFRWETFLDRLADEQRFLLWGLPLSAVRARLERDPPPSYADAIRATFRAYADDKGATRYGDKTPIYVESIDLLASLFEDGVFIHVIRDGRDVALSFLERSWGPKTMEEAATRWKRRVRAGLRAGTELPPSRYVEIRYERLVADPEAVLKEVCRFVELDFDPVMLRYHERAEEVIAGTKYPEQHSGLMRPPTSGVRDWRTQMSSADLSTFEAIAGELLDELGYERSAR